MIRKTLALSLVALFVAGAAFAAPDKDKKKGKTINVATCPMSGKATKGSKSSETVEVDGKKYMVHFCCDKCPTGFNALTDDQKKEKIETALKAKGKKSAAADGETTHLVALNVCPMTGEKIEGAGAGSSVVGKYEVKFCCAGCKPAFDKLSAADKDAKIKTALTK